MAGVTTPTATGLERDGYVVIRSAVGRERVTAALRMLHLAIRRNGLSAEEIGAWQQSTFFPHLRWEPEVWAVLPPTAAELLGWADGDEWAEPQLLMRFPDEDQPWPLEPHVDQTPPWAGERVYKGIVGVALTPSGERDGTPWVWPGTHRGEPRREPVQVTLDAGDALVMHPALEHSGSLNLGPTIRCAIYFRLLSGNATNAPLL
jgi:hypothetical protein